MPVDSTPGEIEIHPHTRGGFPMSHVILATGQNRLAVIENGAENSRRVKDVIRGVLQEAQNRLVAMTYGERQRFPQSDILQRLATKNFHITEQPYFLVKVLIMLAQLLFVTLACLGLTGLPAPSWAQAEDERTKVRFGRGRRRHRVRG